MAATAAALSGVSAKPGRDRRRALDEQRAPPDCRQLRRAGRRTRGGQRERRRPGTRARRARAAAPGWWPSTVRPGHGHEQRRRRPARPPARARSCPARSSSRCGARNVASVVGRGVARPLPDAQRGGDRRHAPGRDRSAGPVDEDHPVGNVAGHRRGDGEGQARLADAPGSGQGEQAHLPSPQWARSVATSVSRPMSAGQRHAADGDRAAGGSRAAGSCEHAGRAAASSAARSVRRARGRRRAGARSRVRGRGWRRAPGR